MTPTPAPTPTSAPRSAVPAPVIRDAPEVSLAPPLMLGYWPAASWCAIVVDSDDRLIVLLRWSDEAGSCLPPLPEIGHGLPVPARIHVAAYSADEGPLVLPRDGLAGIRAAGLPIHHALHVVRRGDNVAWQPLLGDGEAPHPWSAAPGGAGDIDRAGIETLARAWGMPSWLPSREAFVADIAPRPELQAAVSLILGRSPASSGSDRDGAISAALHCLAAPAVDASAIATLLWSLADLRVRDTVLWDLMRMGSQAWAFAADRLALVVSAAPASHVAPAAAVLAIVRWQLGDGTRALAAVERALESDPTYSLATLIDRCLATGMHPAAWRDGLAGLTREECRGAA